MAYKLQLKRGLTSALPTGSAGEPLFTTDTNDLYIGTGAANQRYQKYIASGTSSQFLKGDGSLDSNTYYLASNPSAYIALTALTASSPLSYNNTTGAFTIAQASGSVSGFLSSTDWTTFNNKQNALTNPVTGTGTTNYLPKWTSGTAIGNSILEDIGGNIVKLGNVSISNAALITFQNSVNGFQFGFNSTTTQRFVWNNGAPTEIMCLTGTGNLGLGVTPSAWSGRTAIQLPDSAYIVTSGASLLLGANVYFDGTSRTYISTAAATDYRQINGEHRWEIAASGTAGSAIPFTQSMTLTSTGLGIGTTSPATRLHVYSTNPELLRLEYSGATGGNFIQFKNSSGDIGYFGYGSTGSDQMTIFQGKNADLAIFTNSTERLRLTASGNLGLGVVPSAWNDGFVGFEIKNSANNLSANGGSYFEITQNATWNSGWKYVNTARASRYEQGLGEHFWFTAPSGTAGNAISFTQAMTLSAGGKLLVGQTTDNGTDRLQVTGSARLTGYVLLTNDTFFRGLNTGGTAVNLIGMGGDNVTYVGDTGVANVIRLGNSGGNLQIATTGAATFSNTITAIGGNSDVLNFKYSSGYGNTALATVFDSGADAGNALIFKINNAAGTANEKMRITGSGLVGIGTSSPASKLELQGGSLATSGNGLMFASNLTTGRTGTYDASSLSSIHTYYDDRSVELTAGSTSGWVSGVSVTGKNAGLNTGTVRFFTESSERLRITSGGVVGIGTSSPSERLTVNGKILVQNGGDLYIDPNGSSTILASTGARPMYFEVNGANRMVIKSDGKINFGYLPTSSAGLSSGDIWNDGGTLKIV